VLPRETDHPEISKLKEKLPMRHSLYTLTLAFAVCFLPYATGQTSNQIGLPLPQPHHIGANAIQPPTITPLSTVVNGTQCTTVPTSTTASFDKYYYLSTDVAGQLGINWIVSASTSASDQQVVLIREYRKYGTCPTTDGSGDLQYGATVRATVQVSTDSLKAGLNFAVVAASATLNNQSASVLIEDIGFNDASLDTKIQTAMQDVSSTGLTVTTFGTFSKDLEAAITEAAATTASQIATPYQKLAFVPNTSTNSISTSVTTTFGLSCMAKGWGCMDAQNKVPNRTANTDAAVQQVYTTITGACAGVNDLQKATAQSLLAGIQTVPTCKH
jgi:hypothetical protein